VKTALITGILGQDGHHLTPLLHEKGYRVWGMVDGTEPEITKAFQERFPHVEIVLGDLANTDQIYELIKKLSPDEIYNLAAQSFVAKSFNEAELTGNITGLGPLRILEAIKRISDVKQIRMYQASSSEMFGAAQQSPQNEDTKFFPQSPYAIAKVFAHYSCVNYRQAYETHVSCGILFNHEGEYRREEFVSRKITKSVAQIKLGKIKRFSLGSLDQERDWGYAGDYVKAMWTMLQQDKPDDYVIATGESHSVREFLCLALNLAKLDGEIEKYVDFDAALVRPTEPAQLQGDATKADKVLGWKPTIRFENLVELMLENDLNLESQTID
jgi:GDPmannose 4,6-dehydratase